MTRDTLTDLLGYARCPRCGHVQAGDAAHCARCGQAGLEHAISAGHGRIHSWTTVHRAPSAAFKDRVPYTIVLVDMEEGHRLMAVLQGLQEPAMEQPVHLVCGAGGALVATCT